MAQPKIYYVLKDTEKEHSLKQLARKLGFACEMIPMTDYNREIGEIAGITNRFGAKTAAHQQMPMFYQMPELLILSGMPSDVLDVFLKAYREAGIAPIALRAVMTPTNIGWTVFELVEHLKIEAAGFKKR